MAALLSHSGASPDCSGVRNFASPKSAIFTWPPSASRMFSGFTSQWMILWSHPKWRYASPLAAPMATSPLGREERRFSLRHDLITMAPMMTTSTNARIVGRRMAMRVPFEEPLDELCELRTLMKPSLSESEPLVESSLMKEPSWCCTK
nr:unnamed protein product [Digitaria exilis]